MTDTDTGGDRPPEPLGDEIKEQSPAAAPEGEPRLLPDGSTWPPVTPDVPPPPGYVDPLLGTEIESAVTQEERQPGQ